MKFRSLTLAASIAALLTLIACSPQSSDPLDGPIPECKELLSPARKAYVALATQRCDQARTMNEKFNSVGCGVREKWLRCSRLGIN